MAEIVSQKLRVSGQVQGVGFRPFVYRLARELGVTGWVRNCSGTVEILAQSDPATLSRFRDRLTRNAPPNASPELREAIAVDGAPADRFDIVESAGAHAPEVHLPVDRFTCEDCLREMADPNDRRFRYPFINCTQCGPRYTLIDRLPYDRRNTCMGEFDMCPLCEREYLDPADRRFHAEPIACPRCGPSLVFAEGLDRIVDTDSALRAAAKRLREGGVVAVRGIGGYHLFCDAANEHAVARLRHRKRRSHKPLAVMVPQRGDDLLAAVRLIARPGANEARALRSPRRPIVLCRKQPTSTLAANIAPRLVEVGVFLPYSPLHHLIMDEFGGPLVATSGNVSGEPVLTAPAAAEKRLFRVADAFLHHNRDIRRPADDTVLRSSGGRLRPLRFGRGCAPLELELTSAQPTPVLAVGGHMKSTISLAWCDRLVISPHIGDLDGLRSMEVFAQVIADLGRVYDAEPDLLVCDAHPQYASSRWARERAARDNRRCIEVLHHHAHASAVYGEFDCESKILVFTWDGTGYGGDGSVWGGEGFVGSPGNWRRSASFAPYVLPGAVRAGREPWRSAAALLWASGAEFAPDRQAEGHVPSAPDLELAREAWKRRMNTSICTSAGRLFDAAACMMGLVASASFEGQAPVWLEAAADGLEPPQVPALPVRDDSEGVWRADWRPLTEMCTDTGLPVGQRAAMFHETMAQTLLHLARRIRDHQDVAAVGLGGGVFHNRILSERARELLDRDGFEVLIPERIPVNDAGLCFGQQVEAAAVLGSEMGLLPVDG